MANAFHPGGGYAATGLAGAQTAEQGLRGGHGRGPGAIAFPERFSDAERASVISRVPLNRVGAVSDIAAAVVFLAKDAPYISGEMIHVDGGWNANA